MPRESGVDSDTDRPFFFIHVMKTAGTSFAFHVRREFADAEIYPSGSIDRSSATDVEPYASIPRLLALPAERRAQVRIYTGHFPYMVCRQLGTDLNTLTLLRDPVARTVSVLKHFKRLNEKYRRSTLREIYEDEYLFRHFIENHQTKVFSLTPEDSPRAILRPITIDDDRMALAKENLASVDVVGLAERYGEFIEDLRVRFGWWKDGLDLEARGTSAPRRGSPVRSCSPASPRTTRTTSSSTSTPRASCRTSAPEPAPPAPGA